MCGGRGVRANHTDNDVCLVLTGHVELIRTLSTLYLATSHHTLPWRFSRNAELGPLRELFASCNLHLWIKGSEEDQRQNEANEIRTCRPQGRWGGTRKKALAAARSSNALDESSLSKGGQPCPRRPSVRSNGRSVCWPFDGSRLIPFRCDKKCPPRPSPSFQPTCFAKTQEASNFPYPDPGSQIENAAYRILGG